MTTAEIAEEYSVEDYEILTDTGWHDVVNVFRTEPLKVWELTTASHSLKAAGDHLIARPGKYCTYLKDLLPGWVVSTDSGDEEVVKVCQLEETAPMYDLEIASGDHLFYANGILCHNSTTLIARQRILAEIFPKFRSLFVVPHQEHLDTYANRFREMERAFRFQVDANKWRQNLTFKEYPNGSVLEMLRLLTSATDARGKTADELTIDETIASASLISTCEGQKRILDVAVGDTVECFDDSNQVHRARIAAKVCQGIKHTWRITLSDGRYCESTGSTRYYTDRGWIALCELLSWEDAARCEKTLRIKTLLAAASAVDPGYATWRRQHAFIAAAKTVLQRALQGAPRGDTGGLLQSEIGSVAGLCQQRTEDSSESWLGEGKLRIRYADDAGTRIYTRSVLPPDSRRSMDQNRNPGMAGPADVGGGGVVVSRRRVAGQDREYRDQHPRVPETPSPAVGSLADFQGMPGNRASGKEESEALLDYSHGHGSHGALRPEDPALRPSLDGLQIRAEGRHAELSVLRHRVPEESRTGSPDLRRSALSEEGSQSSQSGLRGTAQARSAEAPPGSIPCESGADSRLSQSPKGTPVERPGLPGGPERLEAEMASGPEGPGAAEDVGLVPLEIVSIEYAGEQEVWDIETEKYHTFFANSIAVHNCQQFDPDLLPELEQTQKSSKIKSTLYSGTSLSIDTLLETKYQESSQGTWHIRAGDGRRWINCGDKEEVLSIIKPEGPTCPYTSRLLDVTDGLFVHAQRDQLEAGRIGLHIPQIIIPEFATDPIQWNDIYKSFLEYPPKKFLQEILGIPTEEGAREITLNDLKNMCCLPEQPATLQEWGRRGKYRYVVSACDWGGSDHNVAAKTKVSFTVHVMLGILPDGCMDIIYMRRHEGMNYQEIAANIAAVHRELGGGPIASDCGVGAAYTLLLREFEGINPEQHIIFGYVGPNSPPVSEPTNGGWFNQLSLNRTESITKLYEAIRRERPRIRCYNWEQAKSYLLDFLNLFRVPTESALGVTSFRYIRAGSKSDDTLHAVNFAYTLGRIILGEPVLEDRALRERLEYRLRVRSMAPSPGREWGGVISG